MTKIKIYVYISLEPFKPTTRGLVMITMAQTIKQFWYDLNQFINAGLPLLYALNATANTHNEDSVMRLVIKQLADDIRSGSMLSEALSKYPDFFGSLEINLIRAGEIGGILEIVLSRLVRDNIPTKATEYKNFYATLALCLNSGVPTLTSLKIAKNYCHDGLLEDVEKVIIEVKNGESFSGAIAKSNTFCFGEIALIDNGEETGNLDHAFRHLADMC